MKAIRFAKTGGPEVLALEDVDLRPPRVGEVRVHHTAIGVNFIDTYHRSGLYPVSLPSGLGLEGAGEVEAVGDGVTNVQRGDRVAYCSGPLGAYAEANNMPADRVVKLPSGISDEIAAAALLKGITAEYLLKRTYAVQPGQTILFHAAAGGVGQIACQWAKHLGATVIGTVGSDEKVVLAKANGCAHVLSTRTDDWAKRTREITGGGGVPVAYDGIGKETFMGSLDCLAVRGMLVSFGNASGAVPAFEPGILSAKGSLYLTRPTLFHYTRTAQELQDSANDLFAVIQSGVVKIAINQRFPLAEAREAHEALHSRATTGATILIP
ncbi:MAG TPA: quinone oxidoreductase [Rhizomicrobium sp.]|jgi:NADPH2:quinone reductase|nr:quinone oxidoreductase [Rhizomicrobium sp.]